jgi:uncharacterized protein YcbX
MTSDVVGTVSELWRYPVKSMAGERLPRAEVGAAGVPGDRTYALVDAETGRIASAKHPRRWGRLLELAATLEGDGSVTIAFPDGTTERTSGGDNGDLDRALSAWCERDVSLASLAPEGALYEEVWDEGKDDSPRYGNPLRTEEGRDVVGLAPSMVAPKGTFFDFSAIHLVTTSALAAFRDEYPSGDLDVRRFRPNLVIEIPDDAAGFVENDWARKRIEIGDGGLALEGVIPTMRCVMVTLPQPGLDEDAQVLRSLNAANRITVHGMGDYACLGLYCRVRDEGTVRVGDEVRLAD